jgi:hypothetical protein
MPREVSRNLSAQTSKHSRKSLPLPLSAVVLVSDALAALRVTTALELVAADDTNDGGV